MGDAINLAGRLQNVMDTVLISIFKSQPEVINKITDGEINISPTILKAKINADRLNNSIKISSDSN